MHDNTAKPKPSSGNINITVPTGKPPGKPFNFRKWLKARPDTATRKFHVTFFPSEYAPTKTSAELTATELAERIRSESGKQTEKMKLPWVKLARFGKKISAGNCVRWDENVTALVGCEIDYDSGEIAFDAGLDVFRNVGIRAIGYTSANYVPQEKERWRFLTPFSKEYTIKDPEVQALLDKEATNPEVDALKKFRAKMVARLNGMFDGAVANESFRLSLSYLYGATKGKEKTHRVVTLNGDFLDLRNDLDACALGEGKKRNSEKADGGERNYAQEYGDEHGGPHGFDAHIALMGDGKGLHGFHNVLISSTSAYAKEHGKDFDRKELKRLLRKAINAAPKAPKRDLGPKGIKRYLGDPYLNDIIKSAIDKYADEDPPEKSDATESKLWIAPHDFWEVTATEKIRPGMLPEIIENVAFEYAERTGMDAETIAMSMLTCCSSVIPTKVKVAAYMASDEKFIESIRIWQANVAPAGSRKTSQQEAATEVLQGIDDQLHEVHKREMADFEGLPKDEQREMDKPVRRRAIFPDTSGDSSSSIVFAQNPEGLLQTFDELIKYFGDKSRYGGSGGEQSNRAFELCCYDSRPYSSVRLSRKDVDCTPSKSIIGGIQPKVLCNLLDEASRNDGLVQRFIAVMVPFRLNPRKDIPNPKYPLDIYENLVRGMYHNMPIRAATLHFSKNAEGVRDRLFAWVEDKLDFYSSVNPQLASHLAKYNGMFLRYCGLFHMIEHYTDKQPRLISIETASKVYKFMTSCRYSHAKAFYGMIRENEENHDMRNIAEYILSHGLDKISVRGIQDGSSRFNKLTTKDIAATASTMVALGWLIHIVGKRVDSFNWLVNPDVHQIFVGRAGLVKARNADAVRNIEEAKKRAEKSGLSD